MRQDFFVADATEVKDWKKNRKKLHAIVSCSKHLSIARIDISGNHEAKEVFSLVDDLNGFEIDFLADKAYGCLELSCGKGVSILLYR